MSQRRPRLIPLPGRLAGLLGLLALAWLALRNAAIALFAEAQPSLALALWPPSGTALGVSAYRSRVPPAEQAEIAAEALALDPLSHWPLLAAAEAAYRADRTARAAALFEAAVRRNSRFADARSRLFQLYLSEGRWSEAIDEGLALARLRPSGADRVLESLLLLLTDVRGRAILGRKLAESGEDGWWRDALVRLAHGGPLQRDLAALLAELREREAEPGLSANGYLAWVRTLPGAALPHVRGVYDGGFRGLPGDPPFNWSFSAAPEASAGIEQGALAARVDTALPYALATQSLALSPGEHLLATDGFASSGARLTWHVLCSTERPLAQLAVPEGDRPRPAQTAFTVPPDCPFPQLVLIGSRAGADAVSGRIVRVELRPRL